MTASTMLEAVPTTRSWAFLLEHFYRKAGLPMACIEPVSAEELPQPYRRLLAHSSDMTSTLEQHHGGRLELGLLSKETHHAAYLREITLNLRHGGQAVEYGVICINLNRFDAPARDLILQGKTLGNILHSQAIAHLGWPQVFFRIETDSHLNSIFHLDQTRTLFGRRNLLLDGSRRILADVIEVLAPSGAA